MARLQPEVRGSRGPAARRARTTLTVYKDKWKNGQVGNAIPVTVAGTSNLFNIVINNGTADLEGVEFEGSFQVTRGLRVSGTFGLNDTKIVSYGIGPGGVAGNCGECNLVYGSFAGATYVGDRYNLSARIGIRDQKWSAELFGTNLTDDDTFLSSYNGVDVFTFLLPPNKNEVRFAPPVPRSFGIRATYEF